MTPISRKMEQLTMDSFVTMNPTPIGWFDLPFEMREMVIDQMDPKTRCRFAQCSKLCEEEAKNSKNYLYGIKLYNYENPTIVLTCSENSRGDVVIDIIKDSEQQVDVVYYSNRLIAEQRKVSGVLRDVKVKYFKQYLEKYKNSIKSVCISDKEISLNDFNVRNLKTLEVLDLRLEPGKIENLFESGFMDFKQFKQIKELVIPQMALTFEQSVAFQGETICVTSKDFDVENISKYLQILKNGEIRENLKSICIHHKSKSDFDINHIISGLDVFDFVVFNSRMYQFCFKSITRQNGKFRVGFLQKCEISIEWERI